MMAHAESTLPVLTMRAGPWLCAVPIAHTAEVMRPLPIEALAGAPAFVLGLAVVRGQPTPVIDLAALLGGGAAAPAAAASRFVTLRTGTRGVALQVEAVLAICALDRAQLEALPPLWHGADVSVVAMLGMLDRELLVVLETARLLPEDGGDLPGKGNDE